MARLTMDNGAIPMSYYSPSPYAHQAPYYVIPQPAHSIPQFSAPPQYVYSPSSASEYGQSNGAPIFKVVPSQTHPHQYPPHNAVPADMSMKEITLQEALENVLRQHKQPKAQVPHGFVAQNARHPVYVVPEGTMLGQPALHYSGYPVYGAEDLGDANRSHLQFGAHGNQQPSGVHYVNSHGIAITEQSPVVAVGESQPYGLPAAQSGMRWKLVPVGDEREEARGAIPIASPKGPSSAGPALLLKSPDTDGSSNIIGSPGSAPGGDKSRAAQSDDPYKQFLSLLFPKSEEKVQTEANEESEAMSKVTRSATSASSGVSEMEMRAATPKSVRIIPVTDAVKDETRVVLEGEGSLREKGCSGTDAKVGPHSVKKQPNKASTPTLNPIRLVPSLDFVKKKESKPVAGSKQEKQVNAQKPDSHQASAENCVREKEVQAEKNAEKVLAEKTPEEAGPKMEVAAKRARSEKPAEGSSEVESHTVQLEKGDEPSAKKKKLITDSETAARLIQSVYRSYLVRRCQPLKHLRDIVRVKSMLKEYQALAADRSSLLEKCKDPAERTKISEGIMSLLLQLDVIQGVDPVVRDIRKYTSKEVLKLQSEVDAAMDLISVPPQVIVSKEVNRATPLRMSDDETKPVDKELATSEESNSMEANESVERHYDIATSDHERLVRKSEDIATENEPTARPAEQPEEQVEDLLRKLLNKLPISGGCEGTEAVHAVEFFDADDSALISEVVKRLTFLKEQQRDKDSDTRCVNEDEFSADSSAHAHIEMQEEATVSDMRVSGESRNEVLHSMSTAHEELWRNTIADDAASHSTFEPTTSRVELAKSWQRDIDSAPGGEDSHVTPDGEREENKLRSSETATSPTELELQNFVETVAADFVDVVLTHTEDAIGSVQSMADNKENISPEGQDVLDSHDTILHEVSDDRIGLPPQPASVDVSNGIAEARKLVNVEPELEGTSHLTPTAIAGGETQTGTTSVTNSAVIDGEDTRDMLQAFEVDNDGDCPIVPRANRHEDDEEGPQILCRTECGTDNQSNDSLMDASTFGSGKILLQNVTGDDKEQSSELGAHDLECSCKGSTMVRIEEATNSDSTKSLADEEKVQDIDLRDGAALQQIALTEVAYDSSTQATLSKHDENTVKEDSVEVKVGKDNVLEVASPLSLADCSKAENTKGLWNDLNSTCHDSLDEGSTLQSIAQDSEEVALESAYLCLDEPCNYGQQSRTSNGSDQSVTAENIDVVERMKVQIPDKGFPPQEERDIDSPTSVLDAVVSVAPAEDVLSVAEIILEDTTSEQPSIQATTMENSEGLNRDQSPRDSSVYEEEALQLQSAISDLQSLNNAVEFFLNDESLQLESAISDLHSLNNTGQGFLNDLNPVEDGINIADSTIRCPLLKRITEEDYIPKPPSLSPEALHILEGGVSPGDICERLCPSSVSSPSSETDLTLTQHLIEENTVLKELVKDVLKWSQWQSSATLSLHKMMEKLALEVLETKTTAKRAVKRKQGRNKKAAKKKAHKA